MSQQELQAIHHISDHQTKTAKFNGVADQCLKKKDWDALTRVVEFVVSSVGDTEVPVSSAVLSRVAKALSSDEIENDVLAKVLPKIINILVPKESYYFDQLMALAKLLSEVHQASGDFYEAARAMKLVAIDNERRHIAPPIKCDWWVRIAELHLASDDAGAASQFIKKCHHEIHKVPDTKENTPIHVRYKFIRKSHHEIHKVPNTKEYTPIHMRYKSTYARVLDSERRFLDAALRYIEISQLDIGNLVDESDLTLALENAATCAILAEAGPSRARVLAMIHRDARAQQLKNFQILEKMHRGRVIRAQEIEKFQALLKPHQQAQLSGGITVLRKAVNEHNMLATSSVYNNIKFSELGQLLGVSKEDAEDIAARMIQEKRMKGTIDQIDEIMEFESTISEPLVTWDKQIDEICRGVNEVLERIAQVSPDYEY